MKTFIFSAFAAFFLCIFSAQAQGLGQVDKATKTQLNHLLDAYYKVKDALVATDAKKAQPAATAFAATLAKVETNKMSAAQKQLFAKHSPSLKSSSEAIAKAADVEAQRKQFETLSVAMYAVTNAFRCNELKVYQQFCPMAFDFKGAYWLSDKREIANPYFGSKMMKCGTVQTSF